MTKKEKKELNYFEELNSINVSEHVEQKAGLNYLSWAWAWTELKKRYPDAKKNVIKNEQGWLYHTDGKTCWVEVSVTIKDIEEIEYLPVMDYKNQAIPLANIKSTNVNTSIQRAITKAIARHGLGLYIYAGEDLPNTDSDSEKLAKIADEELQETYNQQNEDNFMGLKATLESCASLEELKEVWTDKENTKIINSLKKYRNDLYEIIVESKELIKEELSND